MPGIKDMILEDDANREVGIRSVHGYRPLPKDTIDLVNVFKIDEEQALRHLDGLEHRDDIDKRWLAIGRTRLQEAYMAIVRSIFQPTRLQL